MSRAAAELLRRSWVRPGVCRTARILGRLEFHQLDACFVRIVQIELPFAVAPDLRFFGPSPAILDELLLRRVNIRNAERNVIHHTKRLVARLRRNAQHVLDPVSSVRNLHVHPVIFALFHSAVPVHMKAKNIFIKFVFRRAIMHDKSRMHYALTDLPWIWLEVACISLNKPDAVAFGITYVNPLGTAPGCWQFANAARDEISAKLVQVCCLEHDQVQQAVTGRTSSLGQLDSLVTVHEHALLRAETRWIVCCVRETQETGIKN